ncbi:hypothetical protein AX16_008865 [Volvariella volvacea WC 439]|nr:hypothetical protein AX16_008865 [Volvariella volvacea WC 439]
MTPPSSSPLVLYIWPAGWDLPSIDPLCLAALLYLQLTVLGGFSVVECNDPDRSPSGQLPFLTHEEQVVTSFPAIVKYIASLKRTKNANLDSPLSAAQKGQSTAWCSFVQSKIGDLVYNMLYAVPSNWEDLTHTTFVSMLPVPQRYYVPARIRACYKPRLEAAGLWVTPAPEKPPRKPFKKKEYEEPESHSRAFKRAFEKDKILDTARSSLDIITRLLGDRQYFFGSHLTTLDVLTAAHLLVLLRPKFPDPFLQELITQSYSTLAEHASRVLSQCNSLPSPQPQASSLSVWNLLPRFSGGHKKQHSLSPEEVQFRRFTWGFFGFALGSVFAYFTVVGSPIKIVVMPSEKLEEDTEDENVDELLVGEGVDNEGEDDEE